MEITANAVPHALEPPIRPSLREAPLVLGIALGALILWWDGQAFVLDGRMDGYSWHSYANLAWYVARRMSEQYDTFRGILHGGLLGHLGEVMGSYANASILIASCCGGLMVASAGLAARALAGPWAGGLAAAIVPLTANTAHCVRWANSYPLLAATTGAAWALAVAAARWNSRVLSGLAGLGAGLAWATDPRGLIAIAAALPLIILTRSARCVVVFLLALLSMPIVRRFFAWPSHLEKGTETMLSIQREVVERWVAHSRVSPLQDACEGVEVLTAAAVFGACGMEMLQLNLARLLPFSPLGGMLTAAGLLLLLLPGHQRWLRLVAAGSGLVGLGAVAVLTPMVDRYLLQFVVPVTALAAAGLLHWTHRWLPISAAGALCLGAFVWQADPAERDLPTALQRHHEKQLYAIAAEVVAARVTEDDVLLDCSGYQVAMAMLPRIPHDVVPYLSRPLPRQVNGAFCLSWIRSRPRRDGLSYIAIHAERGAWVGNEQVDLVKPLLEAGWSLSWQKERFQLWSSGH